jgi:pyridoxine 5'-phosphate synthase PdxJ
MPTNLTPQIEAARQALASLELFAGHYASGADYQDHKQKVQKILRDLGTRVQQGNPADNFYTRFADALEKL